MSGIVWENKEVEVGLYDSFIFLKRVNDVFCVYTEHGIFCSGLYIILEVYIILEWFSALSFFVMVHCSTVEHLTPRAMLSLEMSIWFWGSCEPRPFEDNIIFIHTGAMRIMQTLQLSISTSHWHWISPISYMDYIYIWCRFDSAQLKKNPNNTRDNKGIYRKRIGKKHVREKKLSTLQNSYSTFDSNLIVEASTLWLLLSFVL